MQFDQLPRRDFITLLGSAAATWPLAARAQQPPRAARLGYLAPASNPDASLSRPEANVTGVSLYGSEIARKRMEIFKEAVVGIQRIAVLANAENPLHRF